MKYNCAILLGYQAVNRFVTKCSILKMNFISVLFHRRASAKETPINLYSCFILKVSKYICRGIDFY